MDTEKFVLCGCIYINYKSKQKKSLCCQKSEWYLAGSNWHGGVSGGTGNILFLDPGNGYRSVLSL